MSGCVFKLELKWCTLIVINLLDYLQQVNFAIFGCGGVWKPSNVRGIQGMAVPKFYLRRSIIYIIPSLYLSMSVAC